MEDLTVLDQIIIGNDGLFFKTSEVVNDNGTISYEVGMNISITSIV